MLSFTLDSYRLGTKRLCVDDAPVDVKAHDQTPDIWIRQRDNNWEVFPSFFYLLESRTTHNSLYCKALESPVSETPRPMGPISNILSSTTPLTVVVSANIQTKSIGRRIAHAMFEYFRVRGILSLTPH